MRAIYEEDAFPETDVAALGEAVTDRVAIDLAIVDARPSDRVADGLLAIEGRDGSPIPLRAALPRTPRFALIGRRYRRDAA
jgi:hypothetical protein